MNALTMAVYAATEWRTRQWEHVTHAELDLQWRAAVTGYWSAEVWEHVGYVSDGYWGQSEMAQQ